MKNEKLSKILESMFEHIPNTHALQFWAPNSYMIIFEHDFRDGPLDFGGFSSKVRFFRRRLRMWHSQITCVISVYFYI